MPDASAGPQHVSRRSLLAATATLAATGGCVDRTRNVLGRDAAEQVSLRILSVPSDSNPIAVTIARNLSTNLQACGVDASVTPVSAEELYRRVLINHDFDVYVGQFPRTDWVDPDQFYAFLHSVYASEGGWQNPFGYTNLQVDEKLDDQRTTSGVERRVAVESMQERVAETVPFSPVAFPDALTTVRTDRFRGWNGNPGHPLTLLGLSTVGGRDPTRLRLATTDAAVTENRNPLAAEFRTSGTLLDLIYDPLGRRIDGPVEPWLAADWEFTRRDDAPVAVVALRDGLEWHDGESLTAADVAFTYRFLADTSMGTSDSPVPTSRYRGRTSLVDDVTVEDDRRVRVEFAPSTPLAAKRAFTIPILPEHVWSERTDSARVAGVETNRLLTEALVWNNPQPVGSGPLQFERAVPSDSLRLSRFDDHFLRSAGDAPESLSHLPASLVNAPAYREVQLTAAGTDDSVVELVAANDADATISPLGSGVVPRIGRESALDLVSEPSRAFYHVGFNLRTAPLSNTRFRRVVARLLDHRHVVDAVFDGYARPAASPFAGTGWLSENLAWGEGESDGHPVTPFLGSDGELDAEAAREAFTAAGYRYDDEQLLAR